MVSPHPRLATRLVLGGISGFVATLPMTVTMREMHRRLPREERYPATPRELIDSVTVGSIGDDNARDLTLAAHYLYGAAAGAAVAAALPRPGLARGAAAGAAVWTASYLGWIPATRLLTSAIEHPARRNAMMIGAHLVWGAATALALRQLYRDRATIIAPGVDRDIPGPHSQPLSSWNLAVFNPLTAAAPGSANTSENRSGGKANVASRSD